MNELPEDQVYRLNIMGDLDAEGLTSKQIADYLNEQNLLTPTGQQYYPKLVWVTLDKYKKRQARLDDIEISVDQDYFFRRSSPSS